MKALITKSSDYSYRRVREIKSLNDLEKLGKDYSLVITFHHTWECYKNYDLVVEIYDDYRE